MKVPVSLPAYVNQLSQSYNPGGSQTALPVTDNGLFNDLLQTEIASGQRVITAQEILSELDGTPEWDFTQGDGARTSGGAKASYGSGQDAAIPKQAILDKIDRVARTIGVDSDLVREVVRAESNFNPNVVSRAGAKGLMQLMDTTAKAMHVRNVYDPDENLAGGTKYLKSLIDRYDGNVKVALAAYNAGPGRVGRLGIDTDEELEAQFDKLPQETQRYVDKIMSRLQANRTS